MDPLAHTLVGATLAETGLKRRTPLATATLLLGANAPDIDALAGFAGSDQALYLRRGLTHGVVAMGVLPLLLTGLMLGFDRLVRRRRDRQLPPARAWPLFWLALLSTLSHPLLDWLNTYGVRLLMPFDGRWFYGDALFIIDPWLWLLSAASVVLAHTRAKLAAGGFILLGCLATGLVLFTGVVPIAARVAWLAGVVGIGALRAWPRTRRHVPRVASACIVSLALYVAAMLHGSRAAERDTRSWLLAQGIRAEVTVASPLPADPFGRELIARAGDRYYFVMRRWLGDPALRFNHPPLPLGPDNAITRAALAAPEVRGLRTWLRLPAFEVRTLDDGYEVSIADARYVHGASGLGRAQVRLDRTLSPRRTSTQQHATEQRLRDHPQRTRGARTPQRDAM